jgi:molecular chaperone GrpE
MGKKRERKRSQKEIEEEISKSESEENLVEDGSAEELDESGDRVAELEAKVAELEDKYLREHADFENIKKRLEKEKAQAIAYAHEQFARDLLSVIDSLDSAASIVADEDAEVTKEMFDKLKEGIELTISQFSKVFEKHGIELIEMDGGFDPNFHEAVMRVDSDDHKEGEIVQLLQKGYKIRDRVLRPAMVSIAK